MSTTRGVAVAVLVSALVAGCGVGGGQPSPEPPPEKPNGLASFDPCTVLEPAQLQQWQLEAPGEPVDQGIGEQGCDFDGESMQITVYKGQEQTREYWESRRGNFAEYEPNRVGTREGIRQVAQGSQGQGVCNQAIFAGGGTVTVQVGIDADQIAGSDSCGTAMEIAQQIEPKLPK